MTDKTYQMLWDCPACGTEKLLGLDHRFCPACGSPQDPEKRYFPSDAEKVAVEDHAFSGADRSCGACDVPNSAKASHCVACGCPLDDAEEVARRKQRSGRGFEASERVEDAEDEHRERKRREELQRRGIDPNEGETPPPKKSKTPLVLGCVGVLGLGLAIFCALAMFWKKEAALAVADHSWERSVEVEQFKTVEESDWCDSVPSKGKVTKTKDKQRDTKKVPDGEDCTTVRQDKGDGTFTETEKCETVYREEPIYDAWCTYDIDKWVVVDTKQASGGLADSPVWPTVKTSSDTREGARKESYTVVLQDAEGERHRCDFPETKWASMAVGSQYTGEVSVVTGGLSCSSLVAR